MESELNNTQGNQPLPQSSEKRNASDKVSTPTPTRLSTGGSTMKSPFKFTDKMPSATKDPIDLERKSSIPVDTQRQGSSTVEDGSQEATSSKKKVLIAQRSGSQVSTSSQNKPSLSTFAKELIDEETASGKRTPSSSQRGFPINRQISQSDKEDVIVVGSGLKAERVESGKQSIKITERIEVEEIRRSERKERLSQGPRDESLSGQGTGTQTPTRDQALSSKDKSIQTSAAKKQESMEEERKSSSKQASAAKDQGRIEEEGKASRQKSTKKTENVEEEESNEKEKNEEEEEEEAQEGESEEEEKTQPARGRKKGQKINRTKTIKQTINEAQEFLSAQRPRRVAAQLKPEIEVQTIRSKSARTSRTPKKAKTNTKAKSQGKSKSKSESKSRSRSKSQGGKKKVNKNKVVKEAPKEESKRAASSGRARRTKTMADTLEEADKFLGKTKGKRGASKSTTKKSTSVAKKKTAPKKPAKKTRGPGKKAEKAAKKEKAKSMARTRTMQQTIKEAQTFLGSDQKSERSSSRAKSTGKGKGKSKGKSVTRTKTMQQTLDEADKILKKDNKKEAKSKSGKRGRSKVKKDEGEDEENGDRVEKRQLVR